MDLNACLRELERQSGSDLHLKAGRPPLFRVRGDLLPTDAPALTDNDLKATLYNIMNPRLIKQFEDTCECDYSYEIPDLARFRVNMFVQRGHIGCVMRLIPLEVPTVEQLDLPPVLNKIADNENGLVLVTGPTGSGKTTTLAAMIEHINQTFPVHVLTVEDPIEFVYSDKEATINQRELGLDTGALLTALRAVLREDPDIILMGEMRDPETIKFGITAAETGHLVFATLHTNSATQTIERILDTMPPDARELIRQQLSVILRGIVCQRLCKRADGVGRIAALEILVATETIRQLIAENKAKNVVKIMQEGAYFGMQTFNQALYTLAQKGLATQDEAMSKSDTPEDLKLMFRGVMKGTSAQETTGGETESPKRPGGGAAPAAAPAEEQKKKSRGFEF
jgi:twitching motility protein PilT